MTRVQSTKRASYNPEFFEDVLADYLAQPKTFEIHGWYGQWKHLAQLLWYAAVSLGCPQHRQVEQLLYSRIVTPLAFATLRQTRQGYFCQFSERGKIAPRPLSYFVNHPREKDTGCRATREEWELLRTALVWLDNPLLLSQYTSLPRVPGLDGAALLKQTVISPFCQIVLQVDVPPSKENPFRDDMRESCSKQDAYLLWEGHYPPPVAHTHRRRRRRTKRRDGRYTRRQHSKQLRYDKQTSKQEREREEREV